MVDRKTLTPALSHGEREKERRLPEEFAQRTDAFPAGEGVSGEREEEEEEGVVCWSDGVAVAGLVCWLLLGPGRGRRDDAWEMRVG